MAGAKSTCACNCLPRRRSKPMAPTAAPETLGASPCDPAKAGFAARNSAPTPSIEINGRKIGPGLPAYIIAEMSANHGQDFAQAVAILKAAKAAGADAIKLQTYTPDT